VYLLLRNNKIYIVLIVTLIMNEAPNENINLSAIQYFRDHCLEITFEKPKNFPYLHFTGEGAYEIGIKIFDVSTIACVEPIHPRTSLEEKCINLIKSLVAHVPNYGLNKDIKTTEKIKIYVEDRAWLPIAEKIVAMYEIGRN